VRYKSLSWRGLFLHSGIVIASTAVCLWSNFLTWWPWLIPLFLLHLVTDWGKVYLNRRVTGWRTRFFFLDQLLHLAAIFLIVTIQAGGWPYPSVAAAIGAGPANRYLVYLLAFLVSTFVVPLLEAQAVYAFTLHAARPANDSNGEGMAASMPDRLWGGAERTLVLLLVYLGSPFVWLAPLAFVPRILSLWSAWRQPHLARVYRVKIVTGIVCVAVIGAALWLIQAHVGY
jgi:hypothetical protein